MGGLFSKLRRTFKGFNKSDPARVLMLGLDAAGKTTILYKIKLNHIITTVPTIGFNVETVSPSKGITFTVWDVGGQEKIRSLWRHYFQNVDGLLFVVDSSDQFRLEEAREELSGILSSDEMAGVPVVLVANKQDLSDALTPSEVSDLMMTKELRSRNWVVQGCCAQKGVGICEAMGELSSLIKQKKAVQ